MKIDWAVERFCEKHGIKSVKQKEVIQLLMQGLTHREMGEALGVAYQSIGTRFFRVLIKSDLENSRELISEVYRIAVEGP